MTRVPHAAILGDQVNDGGMAPTLLFVSTQYDMPPCLPVGMPRYVVSLSTYLSTPTDLPHSAVPAAQMTACSSWVEWTISVMAVSGVDGGVYGLVTV